MGVICAHSILPASDLIIGPPDTLTHKQQDSIPLQRTDITGKHLKSLKGMDETLKSLLMVCDGLVPLILVEDAMEPRACVDGAPPNAPTSPGRGSRRSVTNRYVWDESH
jgi:hypothetical protein